MGNRIWITYRFHEFCFRPGRGKQRLCRCFCKHRIWLAKRSLSGDTPETPMDSNRKKVSIFASLKERKRSVNQRIELFLLAGLEVKECPAEAVM